MIPFQEAIVVLKEAGSIALRVNSLTRDQRQDYRDAIGEAYDVFNTALCLIIPRLGGLAHATDIAELKARAAQIDQASDWRDLLAQIAQCQKLREAGAEMRSWSNKVKNELALRDPRALEELIDGLLSGEWAMAVLIQETMREPIEAARTASSAADFEAAREAAATRRRQLEDFHLRLMADRNTLLNAVIP